MKELNILHISDAHIQKKNVTEISDIVQKLVADLKKVEEENIHRSGLLYRRFNTRLTIKSQIPK